MKKLLMLAVVLAFALKLSAQQGEMSVLGQAGYQTDYKRFGIGAQFRFNLLDQVRLAPDVMFFFPKDKVTGFDINMNVHYVFRFPKGNFSIYPLAGFGMQNNHIGERTFNVNGNSIRTDSRSKTDLAFNLGGGITYYISPRGYLNAEAKYQFADIDNGVFMIGYGYKF